jgi:dTDP-4-dehydrorhamnose 3,5-epimerase
MSSDGAVTVEIVDFELAEAGIAGLLVVTMKQVTDERGTVRELFRRSAFEAAGVRLAPFQQINVTETRRGAVRGLHAEAMAKLVTVVSGEALGAYLDLRPASPTFGRVHSAMLRSGTQVLVPSGVANGFQALSDATQYAYCFDAEWTPGMPGLACCPLDPELGIAWPLPVDRDDPAQISVKDRDAPPFASIREGLRS